MILHAGQQKWKLGLLSGWSTWHRKWVPPFEDTCYEIVCGTRASEKMTKAKDSGEVASGCGRCQSAASKRKLHGPGLHPLCSPQRSNGLTSHIHLPQRSDRSRGWIPGPWKCREWDLTSYKSQARVCSPRTGAPAIFRPPPSDPRQESQA